MKILGRLRIPGGLLVCLLCFRASGQSVQMSCRADGRLLLCHSMGAEDRELLPLWTFHTKHPQRTYGLDAQFMGIPKKWTRVTLTVYDNETSGGVVACAEVRLWKKAEFRPCPEGKEIE